MKNQTLDSLEQLLINYIYEKVKNRSTIFSEDIEILKILFK